MATDITIAIEKYTDHNRWIFVGDESDILGSEHPFLEKNYALYSILANTKDDYEIIDENTTRGYIPIAEPRGIPADADKAQEYAKRPFQKDPGERWYPGWVTLKEILDYPHWNKHVLLGEEEAKHPYADRCREFLDVFVPKLRQLTDNPEHLRLVYYFW